MASIELDGSVFALSAHLKGASVLPAEVIWGSTDLVCGPTPTRVYLA
jgi:hypothetical protein